ncbi:APC family permease [Nocardia sp. BMG51109]|uniref:APC family permease n=1 Tax=Nocardia sp. BMG51109 TaxID=1056816 RepID=UPI0009FE3C0F|nr:APC family permease [Nocardia sp. BMG51109]
MATTADEAIGEGQELAAGTAGPLDVFAQGLAAAAPSIALAGVPASLFLVTGKGAVWAAVIGAVVALLIAVLISAQARRTVSSGSLGTYAGNGLGPGVGFTAGWGLIIGYVGFFCAGVVGAVLYFSLFLGKLGLDVQHTGWKLLILVLVVAIATLVPLRGVSVSARVGLTFEVLSLAGIGIIIVAAYVTQGAHLDTDQLSPVHLTHSSTYIAAVTAVGSYAGFESSAALGQEARDAHRSVARGVLRLVLMLAVLYLVSIYPQVTAFGGLDPDRAPLAQVAAHSGVAWTEWVIGLSVGLAALVWSSAVINAGARGLYTLAREGALPAVLGRVHPTRRTPSAAILVIGAIGLVTGVAATVASVGRVQFETYVATLSNWGFIVAYLLVAVGTPVWLYRIRALGAPILVTAVVSVAAVGYVIYHNLIPVPEFPYNILPYIFLGLLAVGAVRYLYLRRRHPEIARRISTVQTLSPEERARQQQLGLLSE